MRKQDLKSIRSATHFCSSLSSLPVVLLWCSAIVMQCYCVAVLFCCRAIVLQCCCAAVLFCCSAVVLQCYCVAVLLCLMCLNECFCVSDLL